MRFRYRSRNPVLLCCAAALLLLMGGCPPYWPPADPTTRGNPALLPFRSPDELLNYFKQQAAQRARFSGDAFDWREGVLPLMGPGAGLEGAADQDADGDARPEEFTTTNLQEAGVDESDVVKSDGTYLYIAKGRSLRIVRAVPRDQIAELGRLDLEAPIDAMYLLDSRLILLGATYEQGAPGDAEIMLWPPYHRGARLIVTEVEVSDPARPTPTGRIELEGALASSRLTNRRLILVLTIVPDLPSEPTLLDLWPVSLDQVLPKARTAAGQRDLVPWHNWLYPSSPDGCCMTAVVTLDADDVESILGSAAVLANAGTIYASAGALYLTDTDYDRANNHREATAIHKFAFDDQGVARYVASGSVPGRLLNQFSLGEYQGYLRVATHVSEPGGEPGMFATAPVRRQPLISGSNAVYVLRESAAALEITGKVEDIAYGEQLHSARFLGEHGFLVTYRKVDPLFILDLSDPADPRIVGELKVPGFSDYLHPLDDTHLIGVGKYTVPTDEGFDWFGGVQISLFDVSDWSNPTVVQQVTLGGRGSDSEVDYTHKAFAFLPEQDLLAIPMTLTTVEDRPNQYGEAIFGGVVAFRVDKETGFSELGRLEDLSWDAAEGDYHAYHYAAWRRAAFIGQTLYAISPAGVRAAPLSDFGATAEAALRE